jgi:hypothetical protein
MLARAGGGNNNIVAANLGEAGQGEGGAACRSIVLTNNS